MKENAFFSVGVHVGVLRLSVIVSHPAVANGTESQILSVYRQQYLFISYTNCFIVSLRLQISTFYKIHLQIQ
jgi:hypothetical protein